MAAPVDMGAADGEDFCRFHHAGDMTFVIRAAQALGCAAELRRQAGDSVGAKRLERLAQCGMHPETKALDKKRTNPDKDCFSDI
ncbi:hypothetical protein [Mesorhizobium sp. 128a]